MGPALNLSFCRVNLLSIRGLLCEHNVYSIKAVVNKLRPRKNGRHLNENVWILINISLKFVPKGPINNIPSLLEIMSWRRPGDKPLSEPMMVSLLTHICVNRPQWVKWTLFLTPFSHILLKHSIFVNALWVNKCVLMSFDTKTAYDVIIRALFEQSNILRKNKLFLCNWCLYNLEFWNTAYEI